MKHGKVSKGKRIKKRVIPLLGENSRKVQPKLRMIADGNQEVNEIRSAFSSSIRVKSDVELDRANPLMNLAERMGSKAPEAGTLEAVTGNIEASVFIQRVGGQEVEGKPGKSKKSGYEGSEKSVGRGDMDIEVISLDNLKEAASEPSVAYIELGEPLKAPTPVVGADFDEAPRRTVSLSDSGQGEGVLIGIIDVGGFDFAHPDFLEPGGKSTRFYRIWDQGGKGRLYPENYDYGSEIKKEHMDTAILKSPEIGLPAHLLEPQSQMSIGSHGTHVASIAAGNSGVCRRATLAGVLISLPQEDYDRRRSFFDSTRLAHAVDYLLSLGQKLKMPVSINVSLGTNGHAHDGSSGVNRWIDSALAIPGRSVCVAAGNAGQEAPETEDDIGYIMGRIHTSGQIAARGLTVDIEWLVAGNGLFDISENELEIWYSPADRFSVSIKPPGLDWIEEIQPGQYIENHQLSDRTFISIYNELYHPTNGSNYIAVYLSPFLSDSRITGVRSGQWIVRLHGKEVRDGRYHGWIERDDPRRIGRIGSWKVWHFPSFFSERSNVDNSSVSTLACGQRIISVANLNEEEQQINISSSQGPTRDGRHKPDVAAPGTDIVAAKGFCAEDGSPWVKMSGTSMASPYVAGVVGLILEKEPKLTAAQICGIMQRTARPLPGSDYTWRNNAGYGVIDPVECLREAEMVNKREEVEI